MATLHLLSHSPFGDGRFVSCLQLLSPDDGVLLTGDAVYALRADTNPALAIEQLPTNNGIFALQEDLQARGMDGISSRITVVDYPGFVELCARFDKVNAWL